jgi:predicted DNA-binding WGR domain protein
MIQHLVQKNQNGKVKFITLTLTDNTLFREWGQLGGEIQTTSNTSTGKNIGKKNELSPAEVARNDFDGLIKKKCKDGFVKTDSLDNIPDLDNGLEDIDIDNIPTGFCPSKPHKTISNKALDTLIQSGNAVFQVKYNGACHFVLIDSDHQIKIFTRRWEDHTVKYPKIVNAARLLDLPAQTLLLVELCVDPALGMPHMEAFKLMSKISKTEVVKGQCKPDQRKSIELQQKYPIRAAVINFLYFGQNPVWSSPYEDYLMATPEGIAHEHHGTTFFHPDTINYFNSAEEVIDWAKSNKRKIEGLVVWDKTKAMEVTMNGKPNRAAAWKIKPTAETDVIAYDYKEGNGKNQGRVGALCICKFDCDGNRVNLGTVGTGFSNKDRDPNEWEFPCVVEISYANIFPDTQLFQHASFSKRHEDKLPSDLGWPGRQKNVA